MDIPTNQASSPPALDSPNQKLTLTSENWALVDIRALTSSERLKSTPPLTTRYGIGYEWRFCADVSSFSNCTPASSSGALGTSNMMSSVGRPVVKRPVRQSVMFSSGMNVTVEAGSPAYDYFRRLSGESPSGYSEQNSVQALKRFIKRGIVHIVQSTINKCSKNQIIAEIIINVPIINVGAAKFSGTGASEMAAKQKCTLNVLISLYANNVIKEANVEFHRQRKAFMDSSKDLDLKLQGYLNSSPWTFSQILNKIAGHEEYFDR